MTEGAATRSCRNCGRERPADDLDASDWCAACRQVVIDRSTLVARIVGVIAAVITGAVIFIYVVPSERFFVFWLVLVVLIGYIAYKFTRRIAFEIIRDRGVPPGED